jgi:diguanylate cyclase (GGDEF)-like protein
MLRMLAVAVATLAAVTRSVPAKGDAFELAHPAVRLFSDRDGLPQNTVHEIARDTRGYLWVGTQDGAARFNGRTWTIVDMPDPEVSNYVRAVCPTRDGSVWFGREAGGVVRLRDGAFTVFGTREGLPTARVNRLLQASDGTLWAATAGGGAARFDGRGFVTVSEGLRDGRLWVVQEIVDASGQRRLLAGGEGGLARLAGSRWEPIDLGAEPVGSVNSIVQGTGREAAVWLGSFGGGVVRWSGDQVKRFGAQHGLASRLITSLALRGRGGDEPELWVGTRDRGLFRLTGERFVSALGASVSEIYWLRAGGPDDPGALWVGTRATGLLRFEPGSWMSLDRSSGLPADQVLSFLETKDHAGRAVQWIGSANGLAVIRDRRLSVEGPAQGLPGPQVEALAELREPGRAPELFASVVGHGLVRRVGDRWIRVDAGPAFDASLGTFLLASQGPAPGLWVATERGGLGRFEQGRWTAITTREGLPSNHVVALIETESAGRRSLWAGTRGGGVAEVVGGKVVAHWNRASGFVNDDALSLAEVTLPGGEREVWAGTRAGVARRRLAEAAEWTTLRSLEGPPFPSQTVLSIIQDRAGRIYLGTQRGIVRLSPKLPVTAGGAEFGVEVFGLPDGLPSATANWGRLCDSLGRIWMATTGGVALLDPAVEATFAAPPAPLVIETALETRLGRPLANGATIGPRTRDVSFDFALLTARRAAAVRYRTKLIGYDEESTAWTPEHRRSYTNLPAGSYRFRVEARDAQGTLSEPVELAFSVRPNPWLSPGAIALEVLIALGIVVLAIRLREGSHRRRASGLEALVAERTRQLSEANALLAELSVTDPLTNLPNRRRLETHAETEWRRLARRGGGVAFVMIDVDHFKFYNDSLGHIAGDNCLAAIASTLRRLAQRPGDLVTRYGGEEFACLLSDLDQDQAVAHAERMRAAIEQLELPHPASSVGPRVTVSLGVAWRRPESAPDWRLALAAADDALYRAKAKGRNRTELAP